jgi:hypothetical protein
MGVLGAGEKLYKIKKFFRGGRNFSEAKKLKFLGLKKYLMMEKSVIEAKKNFQAKKNFLVKN